MTSPDANQFGKLIKPIARLNTGLNFIKSAIDSGGKETDESMRATRLLLQTITKADLSMADLAAHRRHQKELATKLYQNMPSVDMETGTDKARQTIKEHLDQVTQRAYLNLISDLTSTANDRPGVNITGNAVVNHHGDIVGGNQYVSPSEFSAFQLGSIRRNNDNGVLVTVGLTTGGGHYNSVTVDKDAKVGQVAAGKNITQISHSGNKTSSPFEGEASIAVGDNIVQTGSGIKINLQEMPDSTLVFHGIVSPESHIVDARGQEVFIVGGVLDADIVNASKVTVGKNGIVLGSIESRTNVIVFSDGYAPKDLISIKEQPQKSPTSA